MDAGYIFGKFLRMFAALTVLRTPMRVVGPAAWADRLAGTPCEELVDLPWIWTPPECPFTRVTESLFPGRGRCPAKAAMADDESVVLALVEAGHGLALMREPEALDALARGTVALHPHCPGSIGLSFIHHSRRSGDGLIRALLRAVARGLEPARRAGRSRRLELPGVLVVLVIRGGTRGTGPPGASGSRRPERLRA